MIIVVRYLFLKKICTVFVIMLTNIIIIMIMVMITMMSLNDFECLVSVKNNTVNSINNDNHKRNITLLVDNFRVFICENVY